MNDGQISAKVIPIRSASRVRGPTRAEWEDGIRQAIASRAPAIDAQLVERHYFRENRVERYSRPLLCRCSDQQKYMVKGPQVARSLIAEQVVGVLGRMIAAPVPEVRLIRLPAELAAGYDRDGVQPGLSHGSRFLGGMFDGETFGTFGRNEVNRARLASLAVLFGWTFGADIQYLYDPARPNAVWSADHGHFFPGGLGWTSEALAAAEPATPYRGIVQGISLVPGELAAACGPLQNVGAAQIAHAVAAPVDAWPISMDERVDLAIFLERQRTNMIRHCAA